MVYCGKPSKACRQCRNRNIKCDKKSDTCGQCRRAQLICPGYHNPLDLVFRDETSTTIKKVFREQTSSIPEILWEPLEDRAKNLFISHHVLGDSPVLVYMPFFFILAPLPPQTDYFEATLRAVSLAHLANEVDSPGIRLDARKRYSSALRLTQKSLQKIEVIAQNLMLLTVLLLDLFEDLTSGNPQETSRSSHLEGALALAKFRGCQQFRDPLSKAIFMHLSSSVLSNCLKRETDVPPEFLRLRINVWKPTDVQDPEWQVSELMVRLAEFKSSQRQGTVVEFDAALKLEEFRKELTMISETIRTGIPSIDSDEMTIKNTARLTNDIRFLDKMLLE